MNTWKHLFGAMLIACIPFAANAQFMMFGGGLSFLTFSSVKWSANDFLKIFTNTNPYNIWEKTFNS